MDNYRVALELGGIQLPATIEQAETFQSPHTGRDLRRLRVRFGIEDETTNDRVVDALQAHQEVTLPTGPGQRTAFEAGKHSWSYSSGITSHTSYDHQVELTEQEQLQPSAVALDQIEITPYAYKERFDDDTGIVIDLKTRVDSTTHAMLQAMILQDESYPSYFPVVRKGLQETPRMMRFGKCTWSAHDPEFKHNLVLVEQALDERGPDPFALLLNYPEELRTRQVVAKAHAFIMELLRVLQAKGVLDPDDVQQLTAAAEQHRKELAHEFFRMDDIDTEL
jgi:hypothetical protein